MSLTTDEKIGKWVHAFIKVVIPIFIFIVYVMAWISEFKYQSSRDDMGWTPAILWLGRLITFVPMLIIPLGGKYQIQTEQIDDLVRKQYGIVFCNVSEDANGYKIVDQDVFDKVAAQKGAYAEEEKERNRKYWKNFCCTPKSENASDMHTTNRQVTHLNQGENDNLMPNFAPGDDRQLEQLDTLQNH